MKNKYVCQNRNCEHIFYKTVDSILEKVRCKKCKWIASPINFEVTSGFNPEIWKTPRSKRSKNNKFYKRTDIIRLK